MKTIHCLITFRGHGQLSDSRTLEVPGGDDDVAGLARAVADYWCRSHGSPFAHYCVHPNKAIDKPITGVVSRDVGARYSVIVGNHPAAEYHDFRSKKERDAFADLCREKSISHTVINWVTKPKKARIK